MDNILEIKGVEKKFGKVQALGGVELKVKKGEVHALIGENGAGKSTLMKILSGAYTADTGTMLLNGKPFHPNGPAAGRKAGIAMIYQELNLAPHLSVEENIILGLEESKLGFRRIDRQKIRNCLETLGHGGLDLKCQVKKLSIGIQQLIEITRALYSEAEIIIMDEPTSSLSASDTKILFEVIHKLKAQGISIIYISHFLEEVKEVADSYTVLRDGQTIATGMLADVSIEQIITYMVGRSIDELFPRTDHQIGETVIDVKELTGQKQFPDSVSFTIGKGEIMGIAGLVGSGRTEILRNIFGFDRATSGTLKINGRDLKINYLSPARSLKTGLDMLSEDRKEEGLATSRSIMENITLSNLQQYSKCGWLNLKKEKATADKLRETLNISCREVGQPIGDLSGGNQQKAAIARLLHKDCDILLLDEPTRGIDVGSKAEIYQLINTLATQGKAVIMVSSYLPELMGVCDTLAVMHRGKISGKKPIADWTENEIMLFATSGV
jgi:ribose transport system ATP-binding protein